MESLGAGRGMEKKQAAGQGKTGRTARHGARQAGTVRRCLKFRGTWRSYQTRVLDNASRYLEDGRIHVVAAPGSGKTTLGIELIGRADAPCLILAPSITIREQWLFRIREGFGAPEELLSNDIRQPAAITAITYQALHSCLRRRKNVEEDEDGRSEETDYRTFDLYDALDRAGIGTFCLDEAHHLRSEWQKALEEVVGRYEGCTIISLTATPPYDSTPSQWDRYIGLCGPIDEEISVPELVKEGSLCPHQDFVYFNMPTPEEEAQLKRFYAESRKACRMLMADRDFARAVATHRGLKRPEDCEGLFAENRAYLLALLSFLQEKGERIPRKLLEGAGEISIPPMDAGLLAVLLQGFLFDDVESYDCGEDFRKSLAERLRARGLIHKDQVELSSSSQMDKLLINSRGKLLSIARIAEVEQENLGEKLRLLILTDFIRGEYLSAIGQEEKPVEELGVVPIFEFLRRSLQGEPRLAALSGSVVILPESAKDDFLRMAEENGQRAALKECSALGYYQASLSGSGPRPTAYLTELFRKGLVRMLVGTKSLLGEGWDSPCINSLILASFVGSYMLSNQMRGRAIRTVEEDPEKASNIWHLICMEPLWQETEDGVKNGRALERKSADFATLRRRFEGFLGVNYEKDQIESGLDRLTCIRPPYGNRQLDAINAKMEALSADREGLRKRWERALEHLDDMETAERVGSPEGRLKAENQRKKYQKRAVGGKLAMAVGMAAAVAMAALGHPFLTVAVACAAVAGFFHMKKSRRRAAVFETPALFMEAVANAMLAALQELGELSRDGLLIRIETLPCDGAAEEAKGREDVCFASLSGGTQREKNLFADAMAQFMGEIGEPRYLLRVAEPEDQDRSWYPVPEIFGRRKEDARAFALRMAPCIGECSLIFTKNPEGRKALLTAGMQEEARRASEGEIRRQKQVYNRL